MSKLDIENSLIERNGSFSASVSTTFVHDCSYITTLLDRWHEDSRTEEITATMDLKQGEKTKTENVSQQIIFILYISTV